MIIDNNFFSLKNQFSLSIEKINLISLFFKNTVLLLTRRTFLGNLWLVIKPGFPLATFAIVFGFFFELNNRETPYLIMLTSAYVCWSVFSETLYWTTRTFEANKKIQKKISLPYPLLPLGSSLVGLLMMLVSLFFLISSLVYYIFVKDFSFNFGFLNFVIFLTSILIVYFFALGIGFFTSIFNAKYRDTKFTVRMVLSGIMYLTPVMYPIDKIPETFHSIYFLINPLAAPVIACKYSITNNIENIPFNSLTLSFIIAIIFVITGLYFYMKNIKNGLVIN